MFLLQLQLYVLTIIRVTLRRIQKPLGESPHFVRLNLPFLVKGTKRVSFISLPRFLPRFLPRSVARFIPRFLPRLLPRLLPRRFLPRFLPRSMARFLPRFLPRSMARFLPRFMPRFLPRSHLAPGASLAFSRSSLWRPWSKFWIVDNRVVSYTPLVFRSSYRQFQSGFQVSLRGVFVFEVFGLQSLFFESGPIQLLSVGITQIKTWSSKILDTRFLQDHTRFLTQDSYKVL